MSDIADLVELVFLILRVADAWLRPPTPAVRRAVATAAAAMTTYCVDLARRRPVPRRRCALGGFIGQGELRFSSYGAAYSSVQQSSHLHVQCVTKELALTVAAVTFDDVSRVQGFHDLTVDDQKVVKARFHRLLGQPDTPAPAAKAKKAKKKRPSAPAAAAGTKRKADDDGCRRRRRRSRRRSPSLPPSSRLASRSPLSRTALAVRAQPQDSWVVVVFSDLTVFSRCSHKTYDLILLARTARPRASRKSASQCERRRVTARPQHAEVRGRTSGAVAPQHLPHRLRRRRERGALGGAVAAEGPAAVGTAPPRPTRERRLAKLEGGRLLAHQLPHRV